MGTPSLSLSLIARVMYAEFEHRNHERVSPVCPIRVLGKAVCLVQSVTIPAPIDKIFLCGIFALTFDLLDFLRNQTANFFLTICQFFHPLSDTSRPSQRPRQGLPLRHSDSPACGTGCPGTPPPHQSAAQQQAGRFRSVAPCAPCRGHPVAQRLPPLPSLHDPRHRCCTGSRLLAARPALHALRHCSGKAAAAGSGQGVRNGTEGGSCAWPNSAYNIAQLCAKKFCA